MSCFLGDHFLRIKIICLGTTQISINSKVNKLIGIQSYNGVPLHMKIYKNLRCIMLNIKKQVAEEKSQCDST